MSLSALLTNGPIYVGAGIFAGLASGLMGIGGGIVVVPALIFLFHRNPVIPPDFLMQIVIGTSLAVMIFTTQATIRAHYKRGKIYWPVFKRLLAGISIGTVCGALFAERLSTHWLKMVFALFLIFIALKMLFDMRHIRMPFRGFPKFWIQQFLSLTTGALSGLLGIGGGALIISYLNYCGLEMKKIIPIAALCTMTVAVVGTLAYIIIGAFQTVVTAYSTGFVYWPAVLGLAIPSVLFAPLGAKLVYILPVKQIKYCFIILLIAIAIQLLINEGI